MQLKFKSLKQRPKISWHTWSKNWKKDPHYVTNSLYISSLSPIQIAAGNHDFLTDLFSKLCLHLVECNWISSLHANRAETSYKSFTKSNDVKKRIKAFTLDLRIDTLCMELLKTYIELREVTKIVQILLHGNARAEAGVSINEGIMLSENMSEEALVALWVIYDGVVNSGGLENIKVAKEMMKYVDKAHSQYYHHLKTSKEDQTIRSKEGREKKVEL